ncbi:MAG: CHAP domain-containing protein [Candidatus Saccharimonadales bacterium]
MKSTATKPFRVVLLLVLAFCLALAPVTSAYADMYDDQIRALQNEVDQYQSEASRLRGQADTLQNQLNTLEAEKSALQKQISLNEAELARLNDEIKKTEERLENQKELLGQNLRSMYLESSISPLEMIASANSISDYIDKQEYRNTIRDRVQKSMTEIRDLKEQLDKQKIAVEQKLTDQKEQRGVLAQKSAEQANLLAQTQGQEAAYQKLASQRNSRIAELVAQQKAANLRWGGNISYGPNCGGGYSGPWNWCNAPLDAYVDKWGMYTRECVSYTAFKVWQSGRHMPYWGGRGNAKQWDDNARAAGISVDSNPRAGDVAVWNVGYYGHVMYVEAVRGNGDIYISEYNFDWTGRYSERTISADTWRSQGFVFIHF